MQGKYNFIKIQKVILRNFSLYNKRGKVHEVNEEINEGVYCLAGANGLGKTTFLSAINYGLTGIVLEPNKEVYSPDDIIQSNKAYTDRYFQGRISAKDKNKAEVELLFSVNGKKIRLVRGFSNRDELRELEVFEIKKGKKISLLKTTNLSPKELNHEFETIITKQIGIGKFNYFVFFQLYVLTFDENRRMLFWDDRASTNALSIGFLDDLSDTERILKLKKDMDKFESDGKNERWQATQMRNEIEKLLETNKQREGADWQTLKEEHDKLHSNLINIEKHYSNISTEYDTLLKRQNITNSGILQLKIEYKKHFSLYSEPRSKLLNNAHVKLSKKENQCFLCGSEGHYVIEKIERKLHLDHCPVCDTSVNEDVTKEQKALLNKIKKIDKEIADKNEELETLIFEADTKKIEFERAEHNFTSAKESLSKFEKKNSKILFDKTGDLSLDSLIEEYQRKFDFYDKRSKDSYKKRDKIRPEYDGLLHKMDTSYKQAEEIFVPLFKRLARSFIGIDLNIFPKRKGRDFVLYFEMNNSARTESHQLSESQRFFLDIALRMSLAAYLSKQNNEASMLIDTPEGSLDIAYENRVGKMFAEFVIEFKQNIIMTANINASQLLISLAEKCGEKNMQFIRMLNWTDLSEIQKEGEYLFDKVYTNIDNKLKKLKK